MHVTILDGMEQSTLSNLVCSVFEERGDTVAYFRLADARILPCRSCGACNFKSPGKCVCNDDMHQILAAWVQSERIVFLTPVRFGGYSAQLKKAVDKSALTILPLYGAKKGRMYHLPRYGCKSLLVIGELSGNVPDQEEKFRKLAAANAWNLQYDHHTLVVHPSDEVIAVKPAIEAILAEGEVR